MDYYEVCIYTYYNTLLIHEQRYRRRYYIQYLWTWNQFIFYLLYNKFQNKLITFYTRTKIEYYTNTSLAHLH